MALDLEKKSVSSVDVKFVGEAGAFEGYASVFGVLDSYGDIVKKGAFKKTLSEMKSEGRLPAMLWQHDSGQPIGVYDEVREDEKGLFVSGRLFIDDIAKAKEAYKLMKDAALTGLSIGYRVLKDSWQEKKRILEEVELLEVSVVTFPANNAARVASVKNADERSPQGKHGSSVKLSGVSGKTVVKINQKRDTEMEKKLKAFREELERKKEEMVALATKSGEDGQTFDTADQEAFDGLSAEVKSLEGHIKRLEIAQKAAADNAKAVQADAVEDESIAAKARGGVAVTKVRAAAEAVPGLAFARLAKSKALSRIHNQSAHEIAKKMYPDDPRISNILEKTAVAAGDTTTTTWAANLVGDETSVFADFAAFLRPATILGKFGTGNIPALRKVPFRTPLLGQTTGGAAYWVGEAEPKGLTKFDFARTTLEPLKIANIAVITKELAQDSSPSAEMLVRDGLRDALMAKLDVDFIGSSVQSGANSPASITYGVSPVVASGTTAQDLRNDLKALFATFIAANNPPSTGVLIMNSLTALGISLLYNGLGQREFPEVSMTGGVLLGVPVLVSDHVPSGEVSLVNAQDIYLAEGEITVDISDQASLQMDTTPDSPPTASTVLVSLWQHNMIGFLVEKRINYKKRRASAVALLTGASYGDSET